MIKVITYGTFDVLHHGHIRLLERSKALGDHLIVGLSTDSFNIKKGKVSFYTFEERAYLLQHIRFVDQIIEECCWSQKVEDIIKYKIDIFVMGDDWKGQFDFLKPHCKVIYLPRTKNVSSTKTREFLRGS